MYCFTVVLHLMKEYLEVRDSNPKAATANNYPLGNMPALPHRLRPRLHL